MKVNIWPKITVVFQQHFLWPHLTLKENILLPIKNELNIDDRLDEVVELFDMKEFIQRYPNQVSLGQRQRAALARAIVLRPDYLLLDEITSSLDIVIEPLNPEQLPKASNPIAEIFLGITRSPFNPVQL